MTDETKTSLRQDNCSQLRSSDLSGEENRKHG